MPDPDSTVALGGPDHRRPGGDDRTAPATGGPAPPPAAATFGDDGRYQAGAEIGCGGLGRVFEARDRRLDRPVAVKQLQHRGGDERFAREALITARLEHPAIVPVHDRGLRDGQPFYVMKRVDGRPLADLVRAAATAAARLALLEHVIAVCDAVGFAHQHRIIHRDLKPHNVMVGAHGETVVIDWGLAKELGTDDLLEALPASGGTGSGPTRASGSALTAVGMVMGTPGYMAPEQARGDEVDARADVYALGAMLVHVLGGQRPDDDRARALAGLAPELLAIVDKAMAPAPADRYPDASALGAELRRFLAGRLVAAHRYTRGQMLRRFVRRHRAAVAATLAAVIAIAAVATVAVTRVVAARDRMTAARDREAARVIDLRWLQARAELDRAPARTLGWLRALERAGGFTDWRAARLVAADAVARGVPQPVAEVAGLAYDLAPLADGALLFGGEGGAIVRADGRGGQAVIARHQDGAVVDAAPDGSYAVAAGGDGVVELIADGWTARRVAQVGAATIVVAAADRCAVGAADGLHVLARDGRRLLDVPSPAMVELVVRIADGWLWVRDGREVVVTTDAGVTRSVWRGDDDISDVALAPDQRTVAIVSDPGAGVVLADLAGGAARTLAGPDTSRSAVAWSPDGRRVVAVGARPLLERWDVATGVRDVTALPAGQVGATADGERLYLAGHDGVARVATFGGVILAELRGHTDAVYGVTPLAGDRLATIGSDGRVLRWDLGAVLGRRLPVTDVRLRELALVGPGTAVVAAKDGLHAVDLATGAARRLSTASELRVAAIDDATVVSGTWDGVLTRWDVGSGQATARVELGGDDPYVQALAVAPDRQRLIVLTFDGRIQQRRASDLGLVAAIDPVPAGAAMDFDVVYAPDGAALYVGNNDGTVRIHDPSTLARRGGFELPMRIAHLAISPDGRTLAASGGLGRIGLVAIDGSGYRELRGHHDAVNRLAFAPDGLGLLSTSDDGDTRIWDLAGGTSRPLRRGIAVSAAAWLDGGGAVIDAADDGVIRIAVDELPGGDALRGWLEARGDAIDP